MQSAPLGHDARDKKPHHMVQPAWLMTCPVHHLNNWQHLLEEGSLVSHGSDAQRQAFGAISLPHSSLHSVCQQLQVLPVATALYLA